mmetsp:Transcript_26185/g.102583  ORF Transcript_26185/g.102583 Transcript_26185/m.102583 type:complete len:81 (-) Transcript_26185:1602-1844(-)
MHDRSGQAAGIAEKQSGDVAIAKEVLMWSSRPEWRQGMSVLRQSDVWESTHEAEDNQQGKLWRRFCVSLDGWTLVAIVDL